MICTKYSIFVFRGSTLLSTKHVIIKIAPAGCNNKEGIIFCISVCSIPIAAKVDHNHVGGGHVIIYVLRVVFDMCKDRSHKYI